MSRLPAVWPEEEQMFQASDIDSGRFRLRASSMLLKLLGVCGLALTALFASTAVASGSVVNDDTAGPGPAGANCAAPTFANIQDAVDAASPGDTIQVCAGNYTGGATINKQLSLVGAQAGVDARNRAV